MDLQGSPESLVTANGSVRTVAKIVDTASTLPAPSENDGHPVLRRRESLQCSEIKETMLRAANCDVELHQPAMESFQVAAANDLFQWPSISAIFAASGVCQDYVHEKEDRLSRRRMWESDTEHARPRTKRRRTISPHSHGSTTINEQLNETLSPVSGNGSLATPSLSDSVGDSLKLKSNEEARMGHSLFEQTLLLDRMTIDRLFQSYYTHLYAFYPFLDFKSLQAYKEDVIKKHSLQKATTPSKAERYRSFQALNYPSNEPHSGPYSGSKRKLSLSSADDLDYSVYIPSMEHSVHSAIFLLVLAIGAACEHCPPLPFIASAPVGSPRRSALASPKTPAKANLGLQNVSPQAAIKHIAENGSKCQTKHGYSQALSQPAATWTKFHSHPGMGYYTYAKQILSSIPGTHGLPRIQISLLAALYEGQLARPISSLHWLQQASKACAQFLRG